MQQIKQRLEDYIEYCYQKGFFNGTWLVYKDGRTISKGALGIAHPYEKYALKTESIFDLASVSKQFTAAAVLLLRDRGALSLDDPLKKYFPQLPYEGIRVKNILNHTSGLPDPGMWAIEKAEEEGAAPSNWFNYRFYCEAGKPLLFEPGTQYSYSNGAYAMAALLVESVSGRPFRDFLQEELFRPSGMSKTLIFHRRKNAKVPENYAWPMVLSEGRYVIPEELDDLQALIQLDPNEGDGVVNSNVEDLLLWHQSLRNATVLSHETQSEMLCETILLSGESYPYGYGWRLSEHPHWGRMAEHSGGWPGYSTKLYRCTEHDLMMTYLLNQTGCDGLARAEMEAGLKAIMLGGEAQYPKTLEERRVSVPETRLLPLCGTYGEVEVSFKNGQLQMKMAYREDILESELVPVADGTFIYAVMSTPVILDGESLQITLDMKPRTFKKIQ